MHGLTSLGCGSGGRAQERRHGAVGGRDGRGCATGGGQHVLGGGASDAGRVRHGGELIGESLCRLVVLHAVLQIGLQRRSDVRRLGLGEERRGGHHLHLGFGLLELGLGLLLRLCLRLCLDQLRRVRRHRLRLGLEHGLLQCLDLLVRGAVLLVLLDDALAG